MNDLGRRDRYRGALLGLAVGDALGTTVEFCSPGTFTPLTGIVGGGPFGLPAGAWTDDTSMALCLAESLIERGGFDPVDQLRRYVRWYREGHLSSTGACFDIGSATRAALERFERTGEPFPGDAAQQAAGNGPLMRLAPLAMAYAADAATASGLAAQSARTTHGARCAVQATQVFTQMLIAELAGERSVRLDELADTWGRQGLNGEVADVVAGSYRHRQPPEITGGGYIVASLEAALWALHTTTNFRDGALAAANLGDDADTTAAIYGQLAGARFGAAAIPEDWLNVLVMRHEIQTRADQLLKLSDRLVGPPTAVGACLPPSAVRTVVPATSFDVEPLRELCRYLLVRTEAMDRHDLTSGTARADLYLELMRQHLQARRAVVVLASEHQGPVGLAMARVPGPHERLGPARLWLISTGPSRGDEAIVEELVAGVLAELDARGISRLIVGVAEPHLSAVIQHTARRQSAVQIEFDENTADLDGSLTRLGRWISEEGGWIMTRGPITTTAPEPTPSAIAREGRDAAGSDAWLARELLGDDDTVDPTIHDRIWRTTVPDSDTSVEHRSTHTAIQQVCQLLPATASDLQQRTRVNPDNHLTETRDLVPAFCSAAGQMLPADWTIAPTQRLFAPPEWPRKRGGVDISLLPPNGEIYLEAKLGTNHLFNCVYDLAKMGLAAALGSCTAAFLIVAAADWTKLGGDLIHNGHWSPEGLYAPCYRSSWKRWQQERIPLPNKLPATITTHLVGLTTFHVRNTPWQVRAIHVTATPELVSTTTANFGGNVT